MNYQTEVYRFIDDWGCLDKIYGRVGGDSGHRDPMYVCLCKMMSKTARALWPMNDFQRFKQCLTKYYPAPGIMRRHPDPDRSASDWDRGSRDLTIPFLVAAGLYGQKKLLLRYLWEHIKRLGFFHNIRQNGTTKANHGEPIPDTDKHYDYRKRLPDFSTPQVVGICLRGLKCWPLYWVVFICDIILVLNSAYKHYFSKNDIVFNHELTVLYAQHTMPTGLGHLCHLIFTPKEAMRRMDQHFKDFRGPEQDMSFFVTMFQYVYEKGSR
jgi:hypothetical protein